MNEHTRLAASLIRGDSPSPEIAKGIDRSRLARGLQTLRSGLTGERELIGAPYLDDPDLRAAYLLYHAALSAAKMASVLAERAPFDAPPRRILDIGAGPGSMALAALDYAKRCGSSASAVVCDARPAALRLASGLARESGHGEALRTSEWSLPAAAPAAVRAGGPYDLAILGNVLNELWPDDADRVARRAEWFQGTLPRLLAEDARVVIVEPGLKTTGRDLLALRDQLLAASVGWRVLAPCLHADACPALERPRDWCHQARPWVIPSLVEDLSDAIGVDNRRLVFAYLVLARRGDAPAADERAFRVVSAPLTEKGKRLVWGCGPAGRHRIVRLDRHASEANAAFEALDRGDILRLEGPYEMKGDGLRVGPDTGIVHEPRPS